MEVNMKKQCLLMTAGLIVLSLAACGFSQKDVSPIEKGKPAPDFELMSTSGKMVKLSSFKGKKNVLLAFYPKAGTMG